jgi:hypothetical protein
MPHRRPRDKSTPPFATRLAAARQIIARCNSGAVTIPDHIVDQLRAAERETSGILDRHFGIMQMVEPDRNWQRLTDRAPADEHRARLLAALMGCTTVCPHIRRGGPQPVIARLALHRLDCVRCAQTLIMTSPSDDDRCDVCNENGVVTFVPFSVACGPTVIAGDACPGCAAALELRAAS